MPTFDKTTYPVLAFGACLILALAVALFLREWGGALALAFSGLALGLALRADLNPANQEKPKKDNTESETAERAEAARAEAAEIAELRETIETQRTELETHSTAIDSLAELIEQDILNRESSGAVDPAKIDAIQTDLTALSEKIDPAQDDLRALAERVERLESASAQQAERRAKESGEGAKSGATALALQSLKNRVFGGTTTAAALLSERGTAESKAKPQLVPLFQIGGRSPAGWAARTPSQGSLDSALAALAHGSLGERTPKFLAVGENDISKSDLGALFDDALKLGVTPLITQTAMKPGVPEALSAFTGRGGTFAIEDIRDWSINLKELSASGLQALFVDGPTMANMAANQNGDPRRLKDTLHDLGLKLIAAGADTDEALQLTLQLRPDLVTGHVLEQALAQASA